MRVWFSHTFEAVENMLRQDMDGAFPIVGFYEMKQEIYEIAADSVTHLPD